MNLERLGMLYKKESGVGLSSYNLLKKQLHLIVENTNEADPEDISFTFSGYAPLSVRLIEAFIKNGGSWEKLSSNVKSISSLPGPTFHISLIDCLKQSKNAPEISSSNLLTNSNLADTNVAGVPSSCGNIKGATVIFFIGGVTFAEIAAIRFLSKMHGKGSHWDFVIATTCIISGDTLLEPVVSHSSY